ncbi:MAG: hypothetical protein ABR530_00220 [Pyrinomonadaceae bacterium]
MRPIPEGDKTRSALIRTAIIDRIGNKIDADMLAPELARSRSTQRAKASNDRINAFGPTKTIVLVGEETVDGRQLLRYRADTTRRMFLWKITLTSDGKISEMTLEEEE